MVHSFNTGKCENIPAQQKIYIANQTQITNQIFDTKTERMNTTRRCIVERKKTLFFYFFGIVFFFLLLLSFVIVLQLSHFFSNFILYTFILSLKMSQTARIKKSTNWFPFVYSFPCIHFFFVTSLLALWWCDEKCDNFYVVFLPQFDELLLFWYCYFLLSGTI